MCDVRVRLVDRGGSALVGLLRTTAGLRMMGTPALVESRRWQGGIESIRTLVLLLSALGEWEIRMNHYTGLGSRPGRKKLR
eukprot:scaffold1254_cov376-Prasinococcus_capsulatus_cf.AAC.9